MFAMPGLPSRMLYNGRAILFHLQGKRTMRLSQHFGRTLREAPADAVLTSHQLILRAGLAHPHAPGLWSYLPFGWRVIRRIEAIWLEEMSAEGAEEVRLPVSQAGPEALASLCTHEVESYKDLPRILCQSRPLIREDARARAGLFGVRESLVAETFSLHANSTDLEVAYQRMQQAHARTFARCAVEALPAEVDGGVAHAFMLLHAEGTACLVRCGGCGYAARFETATFGRGRALYGDPLPVEKVLTPGCKTIADLCAFLAIEPEQTLKVVFYTTDSGQVVMLLLRGDLEASEAKVKRLLGVKALTAATEEQISRTGAVAGYASPIGLAVQQAGSLTGLLVIADESLRTMTNFVTGANETGYHMAMTNFVTGANETGYHMVNANYPRDFTVTRVADIAQPYNGAACTRCGGTLRVENAFEIGRCTKPDTDTSRTIGATYLDERSQEQPIAIGHYWIDLDRLLAAIVEAHHDEQGIVWPRAVTPFEAHVVALAKEAETGRAAEKLYADLLAAGIEVLYDDRGLSPGVMFADADLLGVPLRLTVSRRSLENGGVEVKWRNKPEREVIPFEEIIAMLAERTDA